MKIFYHLLLSGLLISLSSAVLAQPLTVTVTDATGGVGEEVCVDIIGANFDSISGMQFSINFDATVLEFASASGSVNGTNVNMIHRVDRPGIIRVSWNLFSTTGYTDAGPFTIGTVCFNVIQATETLVRITDTPVPTEFTNDDNEIVTNFTVTNGTVNEGMGNMPTCDDGIQNGDETGVDCGGSCPTVCPTCDDGVQNGNETGVDCGGDCDACPSTCDDGIQNGNETGVDCGGDCDACPATCDDGIQNGNETGVDCGGDCDACPPTCSDGIQNGSETGIDCGGSCSPCPTGGGPDTDCGNGTSNLTFCLGDACDIPMNGPVCIDLTAGNFTNVTNFQADLTFTTGQLFYQSVTTNDLLVDDIQVNVVNASTVRLLYFQQAQSGVSVPNGTIIGTLCFTNQTTAATTLNLSELVALDNNNDQFTGIVGNGGSVNDCSVNPPTCSDGIMNGSETGIDCGGSCEPCPTGGGPDLNCGMGTSSLSFCLGDACSVAAGATVCLDVTAGNFTNIATFQADITFTAGHLTYQSATTSPSLTDPILVSTPTTNSVRLVYFQQAQTGVTVTNGSIIATLCFTNQSTNPTVLSFSDLVATDNNGAPVSNPLGNGGTVNDCTAAPTCSDGIMNGDETGIDCGGSCAACPTTDCGEGTTDVEVCIGSECADAGAEVCVPVFVGNFTSLAGLQMDLAFTAANLEYTRVIGAAALASGTSAASTADGALNLVWNDGSGAGVSFPADEVAFELCFTVQNAVATPITFVNEATTLRAFNELGQRQPSSGNPGAANTNCPGEPTCTDGIMNGDETGVDCGGSCSPCGTGGGPDTDCGNGTTNASLCLGDYCNIGIGAEVCVELTAGNFTGVSAWQADVRFNTSALTFTRVISDPVLVDDILVSTPGDGSIVRLVYFQQSQAGLNFSNGTVIGSICFTNQTTAATFLELEEIVINAGNSELPNPVGNGGSVNDCTMVDLCNDGIQNNGETGVDCGGPNCMACPPTCTDGIQNGDETGIDCGGSCTPCDNNGGPDLDCGNGTSALSFCLGDACNVAPNAEVCIDITAGNFANVTTFQADLNFNAGQLTYQSVTTSSLLMDQLLVSIINPSTVRIVYFQQAQSGVTVPNGTIIGTLCFTNQTAAVTTLSLSDIIATDNNNNEIFGIIGNGGSINDCGTMPTCNDGIQNGDETGVDCGGSCPTACPTDPLNVSVGSGMAEVGEQVCVNVDVTGFTDITNLALTLNYDPAVLSLSSVTANTALPGFGAGNFTTSTAGQVVVNYSSTTPRTLAAGSSLFTVCFTVQSGAETDLTISGASATNGGGASLTVNPSSGTINAGGMISFDNLSIVASDETGAVGTQVCIDFTAHKFIGLAGMQFPITYDTAKLRFESATGTGALSGIQATNPDPGVVRVIWFDPSIQPNTLDDGTNILAVCFTVLEPCETAVRIEPIPRFDIRAINPENESVLPFDVFEGSVNAGTTGDCEPPLRNLVLDIGNAEGAIGQEVCVDVAVTNFVSLTDLSFSVTYDADAVTYAGINNFGLSSITAGDMTTPTPGVLAFDWDASSGSGQSLADDATLLSICFTVDRVATTNVNFANSPRAIQARNASGQNVGIVPTGGTINPNVPVTDGLTFQIGSATASTGDTVCLPVIGYEVDDLIAFQYTINYPNTILRYIGTQGDFALSGAVSINNSQPGILRILWADGNANGNTVPDGTAIYFICFELLSEEMGIISFGGNATAIEFEDVNSIVDADLLNGQVNGSMAPSIVEADLDVPSCVDLSDGSISLTVSGGPNLTYVWSPDVSDTNVASGLAAGTYSVTVTNPSGQSTSASYMLENPPRLELSTEDVPNPAVSGVTCNGDADGSITIDVIGGAMPYSYDWSGSLPDDGPSQNNLDGGSYSVSVTDANGCELVIPNIMVGEPAAILIGGTPIKIGEDAPGGVNVVIQGGRTPFSYAWSGPGSYSSNVEDINDVTVPGTYCLTVTDNNGCMKEQCFAVPEDIIYDLNVENGCTGENNGSISLVVSGGNGSYDYEWSMGGTTFAVTRDIDDLSPGDYTVIITSGICERTATITIEPEPIEAPGTVTPATAGNNGTITLTPSGGNPPFSFLWADGPVTQNRTDLASGEYCVTIMDESECEREFCFTVGAADISFGANSTRPSSCSDTPDGVIRLIINNGMAPYTVRVEPGGAMVTADTNTIEINVPAGTYDVSVTDAQGGQVMTNLTVDSPSAITAPATLTSDTEDTGCSGMISLDISGGNGPYTVDWSPSGSGATISELCAGDYTATVTDDNGCTFTTEAFTISRIDETLDSITPVACESGNDGEIFVTITGGVAPYTFNWTRTGSTESLAVTEDLSGATAGDFTLTVVDATGATLVKNYTVGNTSGFSVNAVVTSNYGGFGASCLDASDARLEATISGQGTFFYEWTREGAVVGTTPAVDNQPPGTYTLIVSDDGGCEITQTLVVSAPPAITLEEEITRISCGSTDDGAISVTPGGGVGMYTFSWSTGSSDRQIQGLGTGDYSLTVADGNQCVAIQSFSLAAPQDLAITFEATPADDGCNGSIQVLPLGGSGNYIISWPQLPNQGNSALAEGLCPGEYTIEVTDDNGCQTVTMTATVLDRRLPCLSAREVLTPNGDGLNETLVIFCSGDEVAANNTLEIYNRWGQLVYEVADYDCSEDDGVNCFEGRTNDGSSLPAGPYYYVFEFTTVMGPRMQQRGSFTIVRD